LELGLVGLHILVQIFFAIFWVGGSFDGFSAIWWTSWFPILVLFHFIIRQGWEARGHSNFPGFKLLPLLDPLLLPTFHIGGHFPKKIPNPLKALGTPKG